MGHRQRVTRQTIILAAGNGHRITPTRQGLPKPLVRVGGRPLIDHALRQAASAGCEEAVVVVGSGAQYMREHLAKVDTPLRLHVIENPRYDLPNGVSLLAAEALAGERFFLQMADHVFATSVLGQLAAPDAAPAGCNRLLVDFDPIEELDEDDATKVCVQDDLITAIGKAVRPWDAVDAGCFLLDHRVFAALREAQAVAPPSVSDGMLRLAAAGALAAVPLQGVRWTDVDTPQDKERAEELFRSPRATPAGTL